MTFIVFSLLITAATIGIVMLIMLFNYAFKDKGPEPVIKINKFWVILFATPLVNILTLLGSIVIWVYILLTQGPEWIKNKFEKEKQIKK